MIYQSYFRLVGILLALFLVSGCSGKDKDKDGDGSENKPSNVDGVWLTPSLIQPGDMVNAKVSAVDPEGDSFRLEYQWYVDGEAIPGAVGDKLDSSDFPPGSKIFIKARAVESGTGREGEWKKSNKVVIADYPPLKLGGIKIEPSRVLSYTPARAVIDYGQVDPTDVDELFYQWLVNGNTLEEADNTSAELDDQYFEVGDLLEVWVSPEENFNSATRMESPAVRVQNSPPKIVGTPRMETDGDVAYIYFEAEDPDDDPMEYILKEGPPTAYIEDANSGMVTVDFTGLNPGSYRVVFGAMDNHSGKVYSTVSITVPRQKK